MNTSTYPHGWIGRIGDEWLIVDSSCWLWRKLPDGWEAYDQIDNAAAYMKAHEAQWEFIPSLALALLTSDYEVFDESFVAFAKTRDFKRVVIDATVNGSVEQFIEVGFSTVHRVYPNYYERTSPPQGIAIRVHPVKDADTIDLLLHTDWEMDMLDISADLEQSREAMRIDLRRFVAAMSSSLNLAYPGKE